MGDDRKERVMADKHDEVLQRIADQYGMSDEDVAALRDASPLRKRISELEQDASEGRAAKERLAALERAPKVGKAFEDYGVDMENLSPSDRYVLENAQFAGDVPTSDEIADLVQRFGLPIAESDEEEEVPPAAAAIVDQATAPQGTRGGKAPGVNAASVAEWSAEKIARFEKEHPEEMERVLRGETVVVGSFA